MLFWKIIIIINFIAIVFIIHWIREKSGDHMESYKDVMEKHMNRYED